MYLIPRNISKKFEFFPGWGWKELCITLSAAAVGLGFSSLLGLVISSPGRYLAALFITGIAYLSTLQIMPDGSSALDMIHHLRRFRAGQKLYLYSERRELLVKNKAK